MGTFVDVAEIAPRAGNRTIGATTKPSTDDVDAWIDEAEAEILGTLASVGIPVSYAADTRGFRILRGWVGNFVAGVVRLSWAAAGGDGGNEDGQRLIDEWRKRLEDIVRDPDRYGAMLDAGGSAPTDARRLGSHTTDGALGLAAADYAPVFRIKGENF